MEDAAGLRRAKGSIADKARKERRERSGRALRETSGAVSRERSVERERWEPVSREISVGLVMARCYAETNQISFPFRVRIEGRSRSHLVFSHKCSFWGC